MVTRLNHVVTKISWGGHHTSIITEDGDIFHADYVILALPLGVLKAKHSELFDPPLPQYKAEIIASLGFGLMDKIFLEFEEPFWDVENPGIQLVMTDVADDATEEETWQNNIAGFDSVCGQPRVLCGWVCGDSARAMESLSEEEVLQTCWKLLMKYVGDTVPRPIHCTVSRWGSNNLFRGTYHQKLLLESKPLSYFETTRQPL